MGDGQRDANKRKTAVTEQKRVRPKSPSSFDVARMKIARTVALEGKITHAIDADRE